MCKKLSIKILLTFVLIFFSGASITHENIQHNIAASSGDKCVEPTDIMRAQHHIFVKHQSHETVVKGIRTKIYITWNLYHHPGCNKYINTKETPAKEKYRLVYVFSFRRQAKIIKTIPQRNVTL